PRVPACKGAPIGAEGGGVGGHTDYSVVLEGVIILHDLPDLSTAFAYHFGLLYAMNIEYTKTIKYTFEAIQTIFFELGFRCSQCVRTLKTKLLHKDMMNCFFNVTFAIIYVEL
uniref:Uncharacterized protein n=1 Tax=Paramormyrops kingsleyae TaxID=1676925 RepID=A0A3B3R0R8_9TELE